MKTTLTQDHITAIVIEYFENQGARVDMMFYEVSDKGVLTGCIVQHNASVELPEVEE